MPCCLLCAVLPGSRYFLCHLSELQISITLLFVLLTVLPYLAIYVADAIIVIYNLFDSYPNTVCCYHFISLCLSLINTPSLLLISFLICCRVTAEQLKPQEQLTLEPYERDHAVVVGVYRAPKKA